MRTWLKDFSWDMITEINLQLCQKAECPHKANSTKGDRIKTLWETHQNKNMTLEEAALFCKRIHFAEPFINMNGNTMAAIAIRATKELLPKTCAKTDLDEAICTIVAGTVQGREEIILKNESENIDPPKLDGPEME